MSRSARQQPDRARIELSRFARLSVAGVIAAVGGGVGSLLVVRQWVDLPVALVVIAVVVVVAIVVLASPEALVISRTEVRDESGWRRRGWTIRRDDVALVRWDDDPDIFEPPHLTFLDHDLQVLRTVTLEFDPPRVLGALRHFGWPLER
ncbi:hypothetical protein GCM10009789_37450 [Kribbella sancticallisti]|uniref:PH domain-containing protein n=1 Tax=Kribbella sancticallisti TaxID=460087 RepID=A0ABN2DML1_9ACTN